jgi:hypothetical protein
MDLILTPKGSSKQYTAASFYVAVMLDFLVAPYQIANSNDSLSINTKGLTYHTCMHVPCIFLGRKNFSQKAGFSLIRTIF